ncbi:MAG: YybH family protein [Anaeromyxobacteraceae bacterium]
MGAMLVLPLALAASLAAGATADEEAVKAADAALSAASGRRDADAFVALVADDALFADADGVSAGREAVRASWAPLFAADGPRLTWAPQRAVAAASGDLAFTIGHYRLTGRTPAEGAYVTVWHRPPGGAWRVLLDMANRPATSLGPGLSRAPLRVVMSAAGDLEATLGRWRRAVPAAGAGAGAGQEGTYLTVRRRAAGAAWQTVVDSALVSRRR